MAYKENDLIEDPKKIIGEMKKEWLYSPLKKSNQDEMLEAELADNESMWSGICNTFKANKIALVSLIVIVAIIACAILAPVISPYDPEKINLGNMLSKPTKENILGTDNYGRDILSRLLYGSRYSLFIAFVPTLFSLIIGTFLGLTSGYFGKKVDFLIMRIADVMLAIPSILLALIFVYTIGTGITSIIIALTATGWARTARVVRAQTLSFKEKEFVEAACSIGTSKWKQMTRHILPNCIPTLIVLFTINVPNAILSEASLSFLGLGVQPPDSSWGLLVYECKSYIGQIPVSAFAPGVAIMVLVLAFNFLGDGLRDALDPTMKN